MKVLFRCDASINLGSGHVRRCLVLADALKRRDAVTTFVSRNLPGNLFKEIVSKGHMLVPLPENVKSDIGNLNKKNHSTRATLLEEEDANQILSVLSMEYQDWVVVDHYELGCTWENRIRSITNHIFVIDDMINQRHECNVLLNHAYVPNLLSRYRKLVDSSTSLLLGPKYVLLGSKFSGLRRRLRRQREKVRRIIISYGNSDPTNETIKALGAVARLRRLEIDIDVVVGESNENQASIGVLVNKLPNVELHIQPPDMSYLMSRADLALSAGGMTIWEQMSVGLPALVTTTHSGQVASAQSLDDMGCLSWIGDSSDVSVSRLHKKILFSIQHWEDLIQQSTRSQDLVDAKGVNRVVKEMTNYESR